MRSKSGLALVVFLVVVAAFCLVVSSPLWRSFDETWTQYEKMMTTGQSLVENKHYDLAVVAFTEAVRLEPDRSEPYLERAAAWRLTGNPGKAIGDYTRLIIMNPRCVAAYVGRAQAYQGLKEFDKAIEDFSEAIRREPRNALTYQSRGRVYEQIGKKAQASEDFAAARKIAAE